MNLTETPIATGYFGIDFPNPALLWLRFDDPLFEPAAIR
jgi:hypothetical protein